MKILGDFIKILLWITALGILEFIIKYWISSQSYSLYATLTGLFFFILVVYISYRGIKT
jgi:hypothetical protein